MLAHGNLTIVQGEPDLPDFDIELIEDLDADLLNDPASEAQSFELFETILVIGGIITPVFAILIFTSPKEAINMPRPKKVIVLPESQIQDSLTNGRVTVAMLATAAGCSVPTMRKHLAEAYGDRITFSRGRTGGITLAAPVTTTPVGETPLAS